jgi:hypothetical protein
MSDQSNRYLETVAQLESELDSTGYALERDPPGKEPELPDRVIRDLTVNEVKDLYDKFLAFHAFLSHQLAKCLIYLGAAEARARVARAEVFQRICADKTYTNAELREGAVLLDEDFQRIDADRLYFKSLFDIQEERRKSMSKIMERLARELALRDGERWGPSPVREHEPSASPASQATSPLPTPPGRRTFRPLHRPPTG